MFQVIFSGVKGLSLWFSYIFLLFNQPPGFDAQTAVTPTTSISLFNISSFAETVGLGAPIAGTFMLVAPDA